MLQSPKERIHVETSFIRNVQESWLANLKCDKEWGNFLRSFKVPLNVSWILDSCLQNFRDSWRFFGLFEIINGFIVLAQWLNLIKASIRQEIKKIDLRYHRHSQIEGQTLKALNIYLMLLLKLKSLACHAAQPHRQPALSRSPALVAPVQSPVTSTGRLDPPLHLRIDAGWLVFEGIGVGCSRSRYRIAHHPVDWPFIGNCLHSHRWNSCTRHAHIDTRENKLWMQLQLQYLKFHLVRFPDLQIFFFYPPTCDSWTYLKQNIRFEISHDNYLL